MKGSAGSVLARQRWICGGFDQQRYALLLISVGACTLISIAVSGQLSGSNNNIFHLAIMERIYDEPQFKDDLLVQSLRYYASGLWMLLNGSASDHTALWFFLPLQLFSRTMFFVAVASTASTLGIVRQRQKIVYLLIVCLSTTLRGTSPAGDGGLFIEEFSHSELANATLIFSITLAARRQFGWALVLTGVTFFLNAFMAIWTTLPLATLMLLSLIDRKMLVGQLLRQLFFGGFVFLLLALPIISNIVRNPDFGSRIEFDYRTFLMEYWPEHFLIWSVPRDQIARLVFSVLAGLLTARLQSGPQTRLLTVVIGSFTAVWLLGCIAPVITASPTILNLHLLRSSAAVEIFVTISLASYLVRLVFHGDEPDRWFWAPLFLLLLLVKQELLPLLVFSILIKSFVRPPTWVIHPVAPVIALALIASAVTYTASKALGRHRRFDALQHHWIQLSSWAHDNTASNAVLLLPVENLRPSGPLPPAQPDQASLLVGSEVFWTFAHRQIWVSGKLGAAVMWEPSYYRQWRSRLIDVLRLTTLQQREAYAREHGISIIVDHCDQTSHFSLAFQTGDLCAYRVLGSAL